MARRIVIDTDPGLDDALAILFALAHVGLDVAGVTTVGGNIGLGRTTSNALRLLAAAGRGDVPVHAGAAVPLVRERFTDEPLHGADGLGGVALPEPMRSAGADAALWLAGTLDAHPPGTITLAALAPLTNVATLVARRPASARRLAGIVAMGGALETHGNAGARAEFNLAADPEAAEAVLGAGLPLTLIPLDVTRQVRAGRADAARLGGAAGALLGAYFAGRAAESRPLHDPLVPLMLVRPDLFGYEMRSLGIDRTDDPGALVPGPHRVRVATSVAAEAARGALLAALGSQAGSACSTSATQNATPAGIASSQKS